MQRRVIFAVSVILMLAILAGYVFVYQYEPFSEELNTLLVGLADPFVALLAAIAVTAVLTQYSKADKPYRVWLYLTIAMWAWVLAESSWSFIDLTTGMEPDPGKLMWPDFLPDLFWYFGYLAFSLALHRQYELVYQARIAIWKVVVAWAGVLALTYVVLFSFNSQFTRGDYIEFVYAGVDFALCVASIPLFMTFGAGKLSRPWIGLFLMGISDAFFAFLNHTGDYQSDPALLLSLFTDSTYVAAYLILALGFLMQFLLLRMGPDEPA